MRIKSWSHECQKIDWLRAERAYGARIDRRRSYWLYRGDVVMIRSAYEDKDDRETQKWVGGERYSSPLIEYDGEAAIYHRTIAYYKSSPALWDFYCRLIARTHLDLP